MNHMVYLICPLGFLEARTVGKSSGASCFRWVVGRMCFLCEGHPTNFETFTFVLYKYTSIVYNYMYTSYMYLFICISII